MSSTSGVVVEYHDHHMVVVENSQPTIGQCDHVNLDGVACGYLESAFGRMSMGGRHATTRWAIDTFAAQQAAQNVSS